MTRTIAIASGKGGVGKTSISVNVSLHLASQGYKVCLFDADLGLANINILLGINPQRTVEGLILRGERLEDIIIKGCHGIDIIPGSSGVEKMADLDENHLQGLVQSFSTLDSYDFLFVDTSAGVSRQVIAFCLAVSEVVLVITPEPTSLTDAYALLKILIRNGFEGKAKIVVNQCRTHESAKNAYNKFRVAVKNHLHTEVIPLGFIYADEKVTEAVSAQQPFVLHFPKTTAAVCVKHIAKNLLENKPATLDPAGATSFWVKCLQLMRSTLSIEGLKKKEEASAPAVPATQVKPEKAAVVEAKVKKEEPEKPALKEVSAPVSETPAEQAATSPAAVAVDIHLAPSVPSSPVAAGHDVFPLLQELVQAVSAVTGELSLIRQTMEKGGQGWQGPGRPEESGRGQRHPDEIVLDYETWLSQFKRKRH